MRNSSWRCNERFLEQVSVELDSFLHEFGQVERMETFAAAHGTDGFAPENLRWLAM
jgi:hypothetical protein